MNLRFTSDPGHGWLHVKRATAPTLQDAKRLVADFLLLDHVA